MTLRLAAVASSLAILAAPLAAQPYPGWGGSDWPSRDARFGRDAPSPEGKVQVARFRAEGAAADALGKGAVAVIASPAAPGDGDERELATFEAAVVDQLAGVGYDVATPDPTGGQVVELRIVHAEVVPQEAPHKPVSGAMTMGVSNRGSMMGMAVAVDLTKPKKALVSTRLEVRIKDKASGAVLWEGRAEIVTREGDARWSQQEIATKLAKVLFDGFPSRTGEVEIRR
ncbi:hypothetical protein [Novosphingobium sp.]|uniref:hypothetical protein n=1 Tax=Novosphingobium sp. TaxID=1874826 RepID=UPI0035B3BC4B